MKHFQIVFSAVALIGMMCLQPIFAEGLSHPGGAQPLSTMKFSERGKIDSVNAKDGKIVVNGRSYKLSPETRVLGPMGDLLPHEALRKGIFIAFNVAVGGERCQRNMDNPGRLIPRDE